MERKVNRQFNRQIKGWQLNGKLNKDLFQTAFALAYSQETISDNPFDFGFEMTKNGIIKGRSC